MTREKRQTRFEISQPTSPEGQEPIKPAQPRSVSDVWDAYSAHPSGPIEVAQPVRIPDPEAPIVTLYVRKGDNARERIISLNPIPDGVDPIELLRFGFALDGNSATLSVDPHTFAYGTDVEEGNIERIQRWKPGGMLPGDWAITWSLTKAVGCVERLLVNWLTQKLRCQVKFG